MESGMNDLNPKPELVLVHPVIGLLYFSDCELGYEAADDVGQMFDLNDIGVLKSRVCLCHCEVA
jgi:hypothetical protein